MFSYSILRVSTALTSSLRLLHFVRKDWLWPDGKNLDRLRERAKGVRRSQVRDYHVGSLLVKTGYRGRLEKTPGRLRACQAVVLGT